jgi:signal transduction histidine kinase
MLFDESVPSEPPVEMPRREAQAARPDLKRERDIISVKAESTAMIAHQFGTPISAIRLKSYLLKKHLDSLSKARITEHLEQIEAQLDLMVDLLDDLLLVNQVYTAEQTASFSTLDLEAFCKKVIDQMTLDWEGREVMLSFSGRINNLQLDRRLVRYVLSNLVGCILKASASAIRLDVRRVDNSVSFTIAAPDVLLPAHELDHLFGQPPRANGSHALSSLGMELSLMKTCVEMYSGTMNVKSRSGVGTTFVVSLPCRDA